MGRLCLQPAHSKQQERHLIIYISKSSVTEVIKVAVLIPVVVVVLVAAAAAVVPS